MPGDAFMPKEGEFPPVSPENPIEQVEKDRMKREVEELHNLLLDERRKAKEMQEPTTGLTETEDRGEITRCLSGLESDISVLGKNIMVLIERTSVVAAMDRSSPSGDENPMEQAESQVGSYLIQLRYIVQNLSDKVNEHCSRLEV